MSASPVAHPRIIGLDIIRISLMLLIYLFHSHMHYHCDYGLLNSFISMGAIAITAFFMLSGYSFQNILWLLPYATISMADYT